MAKKASKKTGATPGGSQVLPEVEEFLQLVRSDKKLEARFKTANIHLLQLARGLGYTFSKSALIAGVKKLTGSGKNPYGPNTCTFPT